MESMISDLVSRFEKGSLSRRELVSGLAILAASGTAAAAQEGLDFKDANIDHVSIHVADLQRSAAIPRCWSLSTMETQPASWITSQSGFPVSPGNPLRAI